MYDALKNNSDSAEGLHINISLVSSTFLGFPSRFLLPRYTIVVSVDTLLASNKLAKKPQTMEQANSGMKLNQQWTNEILQNYSNGGLCVIPTALFQVLVENMKLLTKSIEICDNIAKTLQVIVNRPVSNVDTDCSRDDILLRLDTLTSAISSSTSALKGNTEDKRLQKDLKIRSTLYQKKLHAEKVSQLYENLLAEHVPFSPPKFREKVSVTAKDYEKRFKSEGTIFRVETQIKIMKGYIKDWNNQISLIDEKKDSFLAHHPVQTESITKRIHEDEEKAKTSVDRAIMKLRRSYEEEKRTSPTKNFLINQKSWKERLNNSSP